MSPNSDFRAWYRDNYMVSTNPSLLQLDALNDAFDSGIMGWTKRLSEESMRRMVDNSLCLGLYKLPEDTAGMAGKGEHMRIRLSVAEVTNAALGKSNPTLIGLSRAITDYTTFGYLTDVYVLEGHQGKGLGRWMMECLNEMLEGWPDLRRFMLITPSEDAIRLYRKTLGAQEWNESPSRALKVLEKRGSAVKDFASGWS